MFGGTDVTRKFYPKNLQPWEDFIHLQKKSFDTIRETLGEDRLFIPLDWIDDEPPEVLRDEDSPKFFYRQVVERTAQAILGKFFKRNHALETTRIYFENHGSWSTTPSAGPEEEMDLHPLPRKPTTDNKLMRPDRCGLRLSSSGFTCISFAIEYKAAHTVEKRYLQATLAPDSFPKVLDYLHANKYSNDDERNPDPRYSLLVAKFLVQTFDYMIKLGLELVIWQSVPALFFSTSKPTTQRRFIITCSR
ncbi:hypothetical protein B0T19DRAFT_417921 [Cercophora scortea]|uniref:Uncharacterized protein n=1 Tax=Cercophora scortea TaxID=314031 RepID=A0AAE0IYR8_9PEZI|nr:hypothetical protein B0T19DRAFT_417921 [Cercophora scortea]